MLLPLRHIEIIYEMVSKATIKQSFMKKRLINISQFKEVERQLINFGMIEKCKINGSYSYDRYRLTKDFRTYLKKNNITTIEDLKKISIDWRL